MTARYDMQDPVSHICFYGTLRSESREFHLLGLNECLEFVGECRLPGQLYFVQDSRFDDCYPAFIPGDTATARGQLYRVTDDVIFSKALVNLDKYEEYNPEDHDSSFYIRRSLVLREPAVTAMAYVYNRAVDDAACIAHGSWTEFLTERRITRTTDTLRRLTGICDD